MFDDRDEHDVVDDHDGDDDHYVVDDHDGDDDHDVGVDAKIYL